LNKGNSIEVIRSKYTIGEHAQISWLAGEDVWVIASQHASIFVRSKEDLKIYEAKSKYAHYAPFVIAHYWLDYFEKHITEKEDFINDIEGKTLCGSYIDNSKFNALLKHNKPILVFHAIVPNESGYINCLLPEQSYKLFNKYKLPVAPTEIVGTYEDFSTLLFSLRNVHETVSNSTMKDSEKGTILYFIEKSEDERVLTMGKIETKEYLILSTLAKTLTEFWKPNEKITSWQKGLENEYNKTYDNFLYELDGFNVSNAEYYRSIAELSFSSLKTDLKLYETFKKSLCDFYIEILKRLGY